VLAVAAAAAGCMGFERRSDLTGPSATGVSALLGNWTSGSVIPAPSSCTNFKWNATEQTATSAKGTFSVSGTVTEGDCSFGWSKEADIDLDLTVTGSGNGPYTLKEELPIIVEETQRHYLCAQAVDLKIEWTVSLSLEDVTFDEVMLPNGATVQRRYDLTEGFPGEDSYVEAHLWKLGTDESAP